MTGRDELKGSVDETYVRVPDLSSEERVYRTVAYMRFAAAAYERLAGIGDIPDLMVTAETLRRRRVWLEFHTMIATLKMCGRALTPGILEQLADFFMHAAFRCAPKALPPATGYLIMTRQEAEAMAVAMGEWTITMMRRLVVRREDLAKLRLPDDCAWWIWSGEVWIFDRQQDGQWIHRAAWPEITVSEVTLEEIPHERVR